MARHPTSAFVPPANPAFEEPTIREIRRWRFEPGERDGRGRQHARSPAHSVPTQLVFDYSPMKKSILLLAGPPRIGGRSSRCEMERGDYGRFFVAPLGNGPLSGDFGVDPGVEPGGDRARQDQALMTALGEIRPLIQSGGDSDLRQVVTILEGYVRARRAANQTPPRRRLFRSPETVSMRLAETVSDPGERRTRQSQAVDFLRQATEAFPNFLRAHKNYGKYPLPHGKSGVTMPSATLSRAIELGDMDAFTFDCLASFTLKKENWFPQKPLCAKAL